MVTVFIGEAGGTAVVHDRPTLLGGDAAGGHRLQSVFVVDEFPGDVSCRASVDPMIEVLDADRDFIDMHRLASEEVLDGHLLRALAHQGQLQDVIHLRGVEGGGADQGLETLWLAMNGTHLSDQWVHGVRLDVRGVLHGVGEGLRERCAGLGVAARAGFDLGIDFAHDLLEDDMKRVHGFEVNQQLLKSARAHNVER